MRKVAEFVTTTVKRAYGDWTTTDLKGWKDPSHRYAVQPIYTKGNNPTDSA